MRLVLAIAVALVATSAIAEDFAPYEGKDAVREGQGGTKVTANGVDFWTTGAPPRAYRVLGVLSDSRPSQGFGSNMTKSKALADRIKAAGGDAAIVAGSEQALGGTFNIGNGITVADNKRITHLVVVKYQDE